MRRGDVFVLVLSLFVTSLSMAWASNEQAQYPELAEVDQMIASRQWDDAEDWIYKFVKNNAGHAEALRRAGYLQLVRPKGDVVRAMQYLEKANKLEADNPVGQILLAKVLEADGEKDRALAIYDALIEKGAGYREPSRRTALHLARFNRALYAAKSDELDRARELLLEVLKAEPQNAYACYELGLIAAKQDDPDEAIARLKKAESNLNLWAPSETWPYPQGRYSYVRDNVRYELGRQLLAKGEVEAAKEKLESVVDLCRLRAKSERRENSAMKTIGHGKVDLRFENAPFFYGEAVAAGGDKKAASKLLKEFSKMGIGDSKKREKAKARSKELK